MSQGVYQASVDKRLHEAYKASKPTNLVAAPTWITSAMRAPLVVKAMQSPRANADQHLDHPSLPMGAQIVRAG